LFVDRLGGRDGGEVVIGNAGNRWTIGFHTESLVLRMNFRKGSGGQCGLDRRRPVEVWLDGNDFTAQVGGDLNKAMALAFPTRPDNPTGPKIDRAAPVASTANSVQVRKQSVIRT
jgi:hypothetical protein